MRTQQLLGKKRPNCLREKWTPDRHIQNLRFHNMEANALRNKIRTLNIIKKRIKEHAVAIMSSTAFYNGKKDMIAFCHCRRRCCCRRREHSFVCHLFH